jgi:hypothetical protein
VRPAGDIHFHLNECFRGAIFEAMDRKTDFASVKKLGSSFFSIDITSRLAGSMKDST